ncbi:MAG: hypothetical protein JWN48_3365 [Myxococcaceae bacterium]|nr:hypothetical protein [Myxococcaceae bacterium]
MLRLRSTLLRMQTTSLTESKLARMVARIEGLALPRWMKQRLFTLGAGLAVPFVRTAALAIEGLSPGEVTLSIPNRRKVQNHMKSVHACAMYMLAETTTGVLVNLNIPDGTRYSTTHGEVRYNKLSKGALRATARLSDEQRSAMREQPKGKLVIPVTVTDELGNEPAVFQIEWAWKHPTQKG